ncbi:MAG: cytochrome c5 family protein [Xanthomonadales bacterium]|nr:cytochrome c5 family protein [Xanthomonadales bacterium]MCC6595206.1 cytochrome c5 family protein [Rhodanobacteraceae bacterium]MDL1869842.1 cytochrome c5 family protein [Gammaproteobacteria bacterium PRO6]
MSNPVSNTDAAFLKRFSQLIGFLAVVAVGLGLLALYIHDSNPPAPNPDAQKVVAQRIAPVGGVYAGDTGRAAMQAAAEAASKAAAGAVAYDGTTDGKTIYDNLCHTCHTAGIAGAPKIGDKADWAARIAQGMDTLDQHAIAGFTGKTGVMPPKGGNPALSDEQMKATVAWMVEQSK